MSPWTETYNTRLLLATIQTEFAREIGQLIYTSQFTNITSLKEYCKRKTKFEWGFQLKQVSKKVKEKPWKDRSKALIVLTPTENDIAARAFMNEQFGVKMSKINPRLLLNRFIFLPTEYQIDYLPNCQKKYQVPMARHTTFQQVIEGHFTGNINADLDKVYKIDNTKWTHVK